MARGKIEVRNWARSKPSKEIFEICKTDLGIIGLRG